MSGDFTDITAGYNGYSAGPGYDLVTGLGTPWAPAVAGDLASVDVPGAAVTGAVQPSVFAKSPDGLAASLALTPRQGAEALIHASDGVKGIVDALFAESATPPVMMPKSDPRPLETALGDSAATHEVYGTPEVRGHLSRAESVSQPDFGDLPSLGLEEA
jgi:hypothetical protein